MDEDGGRVPTESVSWSRENRTVRWVGGDYLQPGEDVEVDSRAGGRGPYCRIAFLGEMCLSDIVEGGYGGNGAHWRRRTVIVRRVKRRVPLLRRSQTYSSAPC